MYVYFLFLFSINYVQPLLFVLVLVMIFNSASYFFRMFFSFDTIFSIVYFSTFVVFIFVDVVIVAHSKEFVIYLFVYQVFWWAYSTRGVLMLTYW